MADIIGFGGKLSGGKSVTAMMMLEDDYNKGKKIISNIPLFFPDNSKIRYIESEALADFILKHYKDQQKIEEIFLNSTLFIDEVRNLLSARKSMSNLNELITQFLMMLGKLDCNFYYTFQIFGSQVDLQLREITHYVFECKRIDENGNDYNGPRISEKKIYINVKIYEVVGEGMRYTGTQFTYDPQPFFKYYNTREFIIVDREKFLKK